MRITKARIIEAIIAGLVVFVLGIIIRPFLEPWISKTYEFISPPPELLTSFPTAEAFVTWYMKHVNKTEAEELATSRYYGKYVRWTGTVEFVPLSSGVARVNWEVKTQVEINSERKTQYPHATPSYYAATVSAAFKNKQDIDLLSMESNRGKKILVLCKISSVHWGFPQMAVMLDECKLEEVRQ